MFIDQHTQNGKNEWFFSEMQGIVQNMKKFATAEFILMRRDCTKMFVVNIKF